MIELRFVKRKIPFTREGVALIREVNLLQMRTLNYVVTNTANRVWHDWTDVPLVEPEDE